MTLAEKLNFILHVMSDPKTRPDRRDRMAQLAAELLRSAGPKPARRRQQSGSIV
jgi:hypothetical protein